MKPVVAKKNKKKRPFNRIREKRPVEMEPEQSEGEEEDDQEDGSDVEEDEPDRMDEGEFSDISSGISDEVAAEEEAERKMKEARVKRKPDIKATLNTIFVGNLPNNLDHHGVAKLFKCCGPVESARIRSVVPEKEKLPPKVALITKRFHPKVDSVNAYVVFKNNENDECIKKALKMNGQKIDGHTIHVDRASMPKAKKETLTSRKKSVFVGNLRFDIRNDELIDHFSKFGSVQYVRLVRDSATGLGKGFGFVVFDDRASVKKALEMNDTQFKGRTLRVKKVEEEQKKNNNNNKKKPENNKPENRKMSNNNDNNNNSYKNNNNNNNTRRNPHKKSRDNNHSNNGNNYRTRINNKIHKR